MKISKTSELIEFNRQIGLNLKIVRKRLNLNQEEMADRLGVHIQTYSRYERGEITPSADLLMKMLNEFNVNPIFLIKGIGSQSLLDGDIYNMEEGLSAKNGNFKTETLVCDGETLIVIKRATPQLGETIKIVFECDKNWVLRNFGEGWAHCFTIIMTGDNLTPRIPPDSMLMVDSRMTKLELHGAGVYVLKTSTNDKMVRRLIITPGGSILIKNDNDIYKNENYEMTKDEFYSKIRILGKVIRVTKIIG